MRHKETIEDIEDDDVIEDVIEDDAPADPAWFATGEHPRHPEVAGQPDPAG